MDEEPRVVEGVGSATGPGGVGHNQALRQALEQADVDAINSIIAEGIQLNDTEAILERKRQYREAVKEHFANPAESPES